jgi:predicted deacetylase
MKLNIGIVGNPEHWEPLLEQEGVPFSKVTDSLLPEQFSAVVSGDDVHDHDLTIMRNYLSLGGGVLCSAKIYAEIRQTTYNQEWIKYLLSDPTSHFSNVGLVDIQSRCRVAWNANQLRTDRNSFCVHKGIFNNGHIIALPFDPAVFSTDARISTKSFYSPEHRLPFERVSTVSRSGIRRLVSRSLELLHHHRGIPYVHLWYYPADAKSIFAFRIDTDQARPGEIDELYKLVLAHNVPTAWFVDVKNQQLFLPMFSSMEHQEIGAHCYEHKVFDGVEQNEANIRQALSVLNGAGIKPEGFVAPFGAWNEGLGNAIRNCGFVYSSEFAYDYDNLPSFPLIESEFSKVLQIPIHPIGVGNLRRQGYTDEQMKLYFDFVTGMKLSIRDPLIFYHHPKDGHHEVLKHLFGIAREARVAPMFLGEYANWWKRRLQMKPQIESAGSLLRISANKGTDSSWLRISKPDGTEAFSPVRNELSMDKLSWELRPLPFALPPNFVRARSFNYRIPLTRTVDIVTRTMKGEMNVDVKNLRTKLK